MASHLPRRVDYRTKLLEEILRGLYGELRKEIYEKVPGGEERQEVLTLLRARRDIEISKVKNRQGLYERYSCYEDLDVPIG